MNVKHEHELSIQRAPQAAGMVLGVSRRSGPGLFRMVVCVKEMFCRRQPELVMVIWYLL